jgi:hypothetical protein
MSRPRLHIAAACAAALSIAAAPADPPKHPMTQERLLVRVDAQWNAWKAMNLHGVFMLYAPSYRNTTSELAFNEYAKGMLGIRPLEYKIGKIVLSENGSKAMVHLDAQTDLPPFGTVPNKLVQLWAYEQGDWWRLIDPPAFPTGPPPTGVTDPMGGLPPATPGRVTSPLEGMDDDADKPAKTPPTKAVAPRPGANKPPPAASSPAPSPSRSPRS